jgi:hypothetical protein
MFGQKFTNTNEMLQYMALHFADFVAAKLAQLNTAPICVNAPKRDPANITIDNISLFDLYSS